MQAIYELRNERLRKVPTDGADLPLEPAVWIDLLNPAREEEAKVESELGFSIPTRADMSDIEDSARLFEDQGAAVMTAVLIDGLGEGRPSRVQVTFILTNRHLVSIRYADPAPFRAFAAACDRGSAHLDSPDAILAALLTSIVGHAADALEDIGSELRNVSESLFIESDVRRSPLRVENRLQVVLRRHGRRNMAVAILRESLLSLDRMVPYLRQHAGKRLGRPVLARLKQIDRDVRSLSAHETQLSLEIAYLHDATLGLINLDQTRIIKAFSVAAVLFLPPTLVGTVYGMNFKAMPELDWAYGYPFAVILMVGSAVMPYLWFRHRGWL